MGWQSKLQGDLLEEWRSWVDQLIDMDGLEFNRHVPINDTTTYHIFGDATPVVGYNIAVYVRTFVTETNEYETHMYFAGSKVAPMKEETTPQMEIRAALLAAEAAQYLVNELKVEKQ